MPSSCFRAAGLLAALIVGAMGSVTQAQYAGLIARVPRGANALVILDVQKLLNSPLGQKENWRANQNKMAEAGVSMVPPSAQHFVLASQMDLDYMQPMWEVAMADLSYEVSIPRIAARWAGEVDRIENRNTVHLADDSYVVQFSDNIAGIYRPANRQNIANWLRSTDTSGDRLSPYLTTALDYAVKGGTPVIMALDLTHAISEARIKERSGQMESLKNQDVDLEKLTAAVASLQGVTLAISVKDRVSAAIRIDFAQDVSFLSEDLAKALILEAMEANGAMIDEMQGWDVKVAQNRIQIGGELYRSGLQRIMSVLELPAPLQQHLSDEASTSPEASAEALQQTASQQYFKSVSGMVDDLRSKRDDAKSINAVGTWLNRYADKVDKLPIVNVDPQLLDYGRYVSGSLRTAGEAIRSSGGKARVRQLNAPNYYNYYGRWGTNGAYGGYVQDVKATQSERTQIRTEERVSAATDARGIMQGVMDATAEIRQMMTQKYNADF
jgi:hypothetical protein